ncbi:hypothetical protein Dimus_020784 [Dionaea muscipula]
MENLAKTEDGELRRGSSRLLVPDFFFYSSFWPRIRELRSFWPTRSMLQPEARDLDRPWVAVSDGLEGDLTEVQGGLTPSMVSDALTGALDNDSCFDEVGGNEFSIVTILGSDSSTATVLGNSAMEHQPSIGDALMIGDA